MGGHLNLSVGVFDTLVPYRMSYPPSITFGLLALFPEDISVESLRDQPIGSSAV
jgi:hypothetical protein